MTGAGRMAGVPFHGSRSAARRWAVALALLALLAQALATQASAGHLARMLSAQWLTGQVCTGAGMLVSAPLFGEQDSDEETRQMLAQCPLCAVGGAAPPAFASVAPEPFQAVADVPPGIAIIRVAAATAAPPPSRGPPSFL